MTKKYVEAFKTAQIILNVAKVAKSCQIRSHCYQTLPFPMLYFLINMYFRKIQFTKYFSVIANLKCVPLFLYFRLFNTVDWPLVLESTRLLSDPQPLPMVLKFLALGKCCLRKCRWVNWRCIQSCSFFPYLVLLHQS